MAEWEVLIWHPNQFYVIRCYNPKTELFAAAFVDINYTQTGVFDAINKIIRAIKG